MSIKRTTDLERKKAAMLKAMRAAIRLKHALAADDEIANVLPELEDRIDRALSTGSPLELTIGQIFDEV